MHFVNLRRASKWTKTSFWSIAFHSGHGWTSYIRIAQPQGNDDCVLDRFFPLSVISCSLGITAIMPFYHRWTLISFYWSLYAHEVYWGCRSGYCNLSVEISRGNSLYHAAAVGRSYRWSARDLALVDTVYGWPLKGRCPLGAKAPPGPRIAARKQFHQSATSWLPTQGDVWFRTSSFSSQVSFIVVSY